MPHLRKEPLRVPTCVTVARPRPASGSHDIALGRVATLQPAASDGVLVPCHEVSPLAQIRSRHVVPWWWQVLRFRGLW